MKDWHTLETKEVASHPVLSVRLARRCREGGEPHDFVVLHSVDWVNVIPVTNDGKAVLIRQWRHGVSAPTLEIPGGLVDPGETPQEAGARELREETGYSAREFIPLGWVSPNPALFDNTCHTFLARDACLVDGQNFDEHEEIEVVLKPVQDLPALVVRGEINHSLVISGLSLFWLKTEEAAKGR